MLTNHMQEGADSRSDDRIAEEIRLRVAILRSLSIGSGWTAAAPRKRRSHPG